MRHYLNCVKLRKLLYYLFSSYEHYDPKYNLYDEPHIVDVSIDQSEALFLTSDQSEAFILTFDQSQAEEQTEAPTKKVNTASSGSSSLLVVGIIIVVIIAVILIVLIIIKIRSKAQSLIILC